MEVPIDWVWEDEWLAIVNIALSNYFESQIRKIKNSIDLKSFETTEKYRFIIIDSLNMLKKSGFGEAN